MRGGELQRDYRRGSPSSYRPTRHLDIAHEVFEDRPKRQPDTGGALTLMSHAATYGGLRVTRCRCRR